MEAFLLGSTNSHIKYTLIHWYSLSLSKAHTKPCFRILNDKSLPSFQGLGIGGMTIPYYLLPSWILAEQKFSFEPSMPPPLDPEVACLGRSNWLLTWSWMGMSSMDSLWCHFPRISRNLFGYYILRDYLFKYQGSVNWIPRIAEGPVPHSLLQPHLADLFHLLSASPVTLTFSQCLQYSVLPQVLWIFTYCSLFM